jgi:two-component system, NtrC family, response regulator AtoC
MGNERLTRSLETVEVKSVDDEGGFALVAVFPDSRWARFLLPAQGTTVIGRSRQASVSLEHESISRRHAVVHVGDDGVAFEDLGSRNGTRVRGQPLKRGEQVEVGPGEIVDVGSLLVLIEGPRKRLAPAWKERPEPQESRAEPALDVAVPEVLSGSLMQLHRLVERIAPTDVTVLLLGETGVGKERLADAVVRHSRRAESPFFKVNCAGIPESLVESELFGHERGAFTGAVSAKKGLLENASGGTLFLDEVGELPLVVQAKLLRVLESQEVMPLGAVRPRSVNVRFIAATHRHLGDEVAEGRFRQDLYFRLNAFPIQIPPLRERRDELDPLADMFIAEASKKFELAAAPSLSMQARDRLHGYSWPGNIRELRNVMERATLLCSDDTIGPEHVVLETAGGAPAPEEPRADAAPASQDEERRRLVEALERFGGNQTRAARAMGIARNTLIARMDRFGLARPRRRDG